MKQPRILYTMIFTVILVMACITVLTGCGGGESGSGSTTTPTFTVTYNGNGNTSGSVPADSGEYQQGQTVTVLGNTGSLAKSGYSFAGWSTQSNDGGTTYSQSQTFTMGSADITLYAKWTANTTYVVTYDGNGNTGGSVPVDSTNYEAGQLVSVFGNTGALVKTGYTFAGWNTQSNGSGTTYTQSQSFTMGSANVVLYALWTANPTYTVTYDGNGSTGGSVPADSTNYQQGQTVTVLGNTGNLVRTAYAFVGWNTQTNGVGTTYAATETFSMGTANVTLYAKWAFTYTVTYNGNGYTGGTVPTDANQYKQGDTVTVLANTGNLVKTGYTFAGWEALSGTVYAASGSDTFLMGISSVTLYAKWTANPTYKVTYDGNGNTGGAVPADNNNYLEGAPVTVKANTGSLVKTNATFSGWNTTAIGNGIAYAPADVFTMGTASVTLFAAWTDHTVATLTTTGTSSIAASKAYTGGTISNNGGAAVTARGVCWDLSTGPTTSNSKTTDGSGNGSFTSLITGLTPSTTYYVRAYATNAIGTAYGDEISFTTSSTYSYGDTGPAGGLIFYTQGTGTWTYLEAAAVDQFNGSSVTSPYWGDDTQSISTLTSIGSGSANTAAMVANLGAGTWHAGGFCRAISLGGNTDWFLPSKDELNQMYLNLPDKSSFNGTYYWSSSQDSFDSRNAWAQSMASGAPASMIKTYTYYSARCVRLF